MDTLPSRRGVGRLLLALGAAGVSARVGAQEGPASYPARPITLVVPYGAGSSTDILARLLTDRAGALLGHAIVVDNRGGASGILGTKAAARAGTDGNTLVLGHTPPPRAGAPGNRICGSSRKPGPPGSPQRSMERFQPNHTRFA